MATEYLRIHPVGKHGKTSLCSLQHCLSLPNSGKYLNIRPLQITDYRLQITVAHCALDVHWNILQQSRNIIDLISSAKSRMP